MADISLDILKQDLNNNLEHLDDHTEVVNYSNAIVPEGRAFARMVGYVELGKQPQPDYQGKPRDPADEVLIEFELQTIKPETGEYTRTFTKDDKEHTVGSRITLNLTVSSSPKSKFRKLLNLLSTGRPEVENMASLLGVGCIMVVKHKQSKSSDRKYPVVWDTENSKWTIFPELQEDEVTGEIKKLTIPPILGGCKLFTWKAPTMNYWNSIHIEGTYTKKDKDGNEVEVSKNWIQQKIIDAINYEGSPIQQLLDTGGMAEALATEVTKPSKASSEEPQIVSKAPKVETPKEEPKVAEKAPETVTEVKAEPKEEPKAETSKADQAQADLDAALALLDS